MCVLDPLQPTLSATYAADIQRSIRPFALPLATYSPLSHREPCILCNQPHAIQASPSPDTSSRCVTHTSNSTPVATPFS